MFNRSLYHFYLVNPSKISLHEAYFFRGHIELISYRQTIIIALRIE